MCRQRGADIRTRRGSQSARNTQARAEDEELLDKGLKKRAMEAVCKGKNFQRSTQDTEGGLKPREGGGGTYPILGISSTHSWHL